MIEYPRWTASYSNEDLDRSYQLACDLAGHGRPSKELLEQATGIVRRANNYSSCTCAGDHPCGFAVCEQRVPRMEPPAGTWASVARMMAQEFPDFEWDYWKDRCKEEDC